MRTFIEFIKHIFRESLRLFLGFIRLHKKIYTVKNFFAPDNLLALVFILGLFIGLGLLGIQFRILDPIGEAFSDVEITDVMFSQMGKNEEMRGSYNGEDFHVKQDPDITIVNIGHLNRFDIARLVYTIQGCKPKVTALDVWFPEAKPDSMHSDMILTDIFSQDSNIVIVNKWKHDKKGHIIGINNAYEPFALNTHGAFADMDIDASQGSASHDVVRKFFSHITVGKDTFPAFATKIAELYAPEKVKKLYGRQKEEERINYVGNIYIPFYEERYSDKNNYAPLNNHPYFRTYEYDDVIQQNFDSLDFKDKIVLLGYLGDRVYTHAAEDKFFTPLNHNYVGKASRDMYGVVIHANIIRTILNENYIDELPNWAGHVLGFFVLYIVFATFRPIYNDYKVWYDGLTKAMGIIMSLGILIVIGLIFDTYNYELKFGAIYFGCILLAGDFLEIYYGLIKNIVGKFRA